MDRVPRSTHPGQRNTDCASVPRSNVQPAKQRPQPLLFPWVFWAAPERWPCRNVPQLGMHIRPIRLGHVVRHLTGSIRKQAALKDLNPTSPPAEASLSLQPLHVRNTPILSRDQRQCFAQTDGLKIHLTEAAGRLISSALAISS